ncbi:MAG: hypothetical protein F6K65_41730 [Moorea sp. SIO3C2]|nr:hypothetical protein [Moorena sp. SIO3C2]
MSNHLKQRSPSPFHTAIAPQNPNPPAIAHQNPPNCDRLSKPHSTAIAPTITPSSDRPLADCL